MFDRRDIKDLLNGLRHKNIMKFIHVQIAIRDILRKSLTKIHLAKRNAGHRKERLITYPNISPEFNLATISKSPSQTSLKHLWAIQNSFPGTGSSTRGLRTSLKISPRYFFLIKSAWSFFQNLQLAFASMASWRFWKKAISLTQEGVPPRRLMRTRFPRRERSNESEAPGQTAFVVACIAF